MADSTAPTEVRMNSVFAGVRWGMDRMLAVAYGVVYDYIFERFQPYRDLVPEVVRLVESSVPPATNRRDVRILDIGCGPGNFTLALGTAGFSVIGVDSYESLVDLAREKRRWSHLPNVAFQHADITRGDEVRLSGLDQVVNIHSLYAHPDPMALLRGASRVLKPGGHAVFVNLTRRLPVWATFRQTRARAGLGAAVACLVWVVPNAMFEVMRKQHGPRYWNEAEFAAHLGEAGFTVLEMRRTFFEGISLLAWVRKDVESDGEERGGDGGSRT